MRRVHQFPQTRWTLIGSLQDGTEEEKEAVWDWVSRNYWGPIYCFLRADGRDREEAQDLTQQFFEKILTEEVLEKARPEQGKLRSFLLGVLKRMIFSQERWERTLKRGGGRAPLSIDTTNFELIYRESCSHGEGPEQIYERCWVLALLEAAGKKLQGEFSQQGRSELFSELEPYLRNEDSKPSYEELATKLESTSGAVRLLVYRLRKRLRELLEEEIGQTLEEPSELVSECDWVRVILRRNP